MMVASAFSSRSVCTHSSTFSSVIICVRLTTIVDACSTWFLKNSPKFFMYIFAFLPSTTVILPSISISASFSTASIALATSDNLPTPDGSMITRSGWYSSSTFTSALLKSPTRVQQIHPEFISVISIPASFRNPPSIPISPNSFSISTSFSPAHTSLSSFLINVVFPAPRNPEIISTFVIFIASFLSIFKYY